jgi:hypothetical protein
VVLEADWLSQAPAAQGPDLAATDAEPGSRAGYDREGRLTVLDLGTGRGMVRVEPGPASGGAHVRTYLLTGARRSGPFVVGATAVEERAEGGLARTCTWLADTDYGDLETTRDYALEGARVARCHESQRARGDDGPPDEVDYLFDRASDGALAAVRTRRKGQKKDHTLYRAPTPSAPAEARDEKRTEPRVDQKSEPDDEGLAATLADELVRLCEKNRAHDLAALALVRSAETHEEPLVAALPRTEAARLAELGARDVWSLLCAAEWESLEARRWQLSEKVARPLRERSLRGVAHGEPSGAPAVLERALALARPRLEALGSGPGLVLFSTEPSQGSLRASVERLSSKASLAALAALIELAPKAASSKVASKKAAPAKAASKKAAPTRVSKKERG